MAKNGICRVIYDKEYDSYVLELRNKDEKDWVTVMIAKCQPDKGVMQHSSTTPSSPSCSRPCPMGTN